MSRVDVRLAVRDSPDWARFLFTVRDAISLARPSLSPRSLALDLTCSYCRSRLSDHDPCGMTTSRQRDLANAGFPLRPCQNCSKVERTALRASPRSWDRAKPG